MNDIRGLSDVSHPSLVQFIGAYRVPDKGQVSIVMEYLIVGSLGYFLNWVPPPPPPAPAPTLTQQHTPTSPHAPHNLLLSYLVCPPGVSISTFEQIPLKPRMPWLRLYNRNS